VKSREKEAVRQDSEGKYVRSTLATTKSPYTGTNSSNPQLNIAVPFVVHMGDTYVGPILSITLVRRNTRYRRLTILVQPADVRRAPSFD